MVATGSAGFDPLTDVGGAGCVAGFSGKIDLIVGETSSSSSFEMSITSPSFLGARNFGLSEFSAIPEKFPSFWSTPCACCPFTDARIAITFPLSNCRQIPFGDLSTMTF